ncbi:MAG: hypothetical protein ACI8WW_002718, partial [Oceanospirillaceae bacterium]
CSVSFINCGSEYKLSRVVSMSQLPVQDGRTEG